MRVARAGDRISVLDEAGRELARADLRWIDGDPAAFDLRVDGGAGALRRLLREFQSMSAAGGLYITIDAQDPKALGLFSLFLRLGAAPSMLVMRVEPDSGG